MVGLTKTGCLFVVATPIGNRGDLTLRAIDTMRECDLIACENTHRIRRLIEPLNIDKPLLRYHEGNEKQMALQLANQVADGEKITLVTEAGTPGISDPGFRVIRECRKRGLTVEPIPGVSAVITALSVSGLPTDSFLFLGFLPPKTAARKRLFQQYAEAEFSLVFYESTHRIEKFLVDLIEIMGETRTICLARELTKLHETILTGPVGGVLEELRNSSKKGEFVVIIAKNGFSL